MNAKKVVLCLLMLASITFVKAQIAVNEVSSVTEMSGEIVTKVKLAKEYFITSTDPDAGRTFDERVANLSVGIRIVADFVAHSYQATRKLKRATTLEFTT
jgi:hypothetical protein